MSWEMTQVQIDKAIFEHMDAASRFGNEDVNLVAAEILLLASRADHSIFPNPTNHQLIMDNLNAVGGVRMHQATFPFLMKVGN